MAAPNLDGITSLGKVPLLGQDFVSVKREHLAFFKQVLQNAYGQLHYAALAEAALTFGTPEDPPLAKAVAAVGQAVMDYLEDGEAVLPHERNDADAPA